jgi:4-hydroxybenzoate polyprenyltransferase
MVGNLRFFLDELRRFLRVDTSLLVSCIAMSGYLIFNEPSGEWIFLFTAIFFGTSAQYSYNFCTDKEEDAVNYERLNIFVIKNRGYPVILACALISIASALQLPYLTLAIYAISMVAGFIYSGFRIKRFFLVKNLYTGLFMSTTFFMGATIGNQNLGEIAPYLPLLFLFCMSGNLFGDVRGYEGDRLAGLKTIPIRFGRRAAKYIIYLNFSVISASSILLGYFFLLPMMPSMFATSFFLNRDKYKMARSSHLLTFIVLAPFLAMMRFLEV